MTARQASVVAVLNMKGGVGKTTIAAAVFREMQKATARRILLVDFDSQYNLTQLLVTGARYQELLEQKRTLWHVLTPPALVNVFQISDDDLATPEPVSSYVVPLRWVRSGSERVFIDLLPGDFRTAAINLLTDATSLRVRSLRFKSLIMNARTEYDLVVADCNPSSSFMTRTAVEVSTNLLVPVRPDSYSILGLDMIVDFIENLPTLADPPNISILVNDLATHEQHGSVLAQLRSNAFYGPRTLVNTLPDSRHLMAHSNRVGFPNDRGGPYSRVVGDKIRRIANELVPVLGL